MAGHLCRDRIEALQLRLVEHHRYRAHVLAQIFHVAGTRDGHHVLTAGQHPGQCDLAGLHPDLGGDGRDGVGQCAVVVEGVGTETRVPELDTGDVITGTHPAGEPASAQRGIRHDTDTEFTGDRDGVALDIPCEDGPFVLHRGDRVHGMRATQGLRAGFGQADVPDLACGDQFGQRPDRLLDG